MRLLYFDDEGKLCLTADEPPAYPYAILSHTWGRDEDEVTFRDLQDGTGESKEGYAKIMFCGEQAKKDNLKYFWVDTCCIDKSSSSELTEAINSMFRWYKKAGKCYVYLSDVSFESDEERDYQYLWEPAFEQSRWFRRGWTLQELIAPASVEFFSKQWIRLGSKTSLETVLQGITNIPIAALRGAPLSQFSIKERMQWAEKRQTKKIEDKAYCLLGVFDVSMPLVYGEEDKAFVRLERVIRESTEATPNLETNVHWCVKRSGNPLFVGRQDILDDLENAVRAGVSNRSTDHQCHIVIVGIGGQGKSELCLQLTRRVRAAFWGVFWVDVSTISTAENDFLEIASQLKAPSRTWHNGRQQLANSHQPWLLILDNADDPEIDFEEFFPSGQSGVVVLTSRNDDCKQYATNPPIVLEGLHISEAQSLILKAAKTPITQRGALEGDARTVATLLQSHPLALIQAGAYVARGHCTLAEYPQVFERQRKRLLTFRPSQARSRHGDVFATFEASAEILKSSHAESSQDALELLPLLSVTGPDHFPLQLFEAGWDTAQLILMGGCVIGLLSSRHVTHLPTFLIHDGRDWDPFRLREAVHTLKALALLTTDDHARPNSVSMHPLTHMWARDRQNEQQQHESWMKMGCIMALSRGYKELWRSHAHRLLPHLQSLVDWDMNCIFRSESKRMTADILLEVAWQLNRMRDRKILAKLLNRLCVQLGLKESVVDRDWIHLYCLIGVNLRERGKHAEAVPLLEQVVQASENSEDWDTSQFGAQEDLARAYLSAGQFAQSVRLFEKIVESQMYLSEDHPRRCASQQELARSYQASGQTVRAIEILEKLVEVQERASPEDDRFRLAAQYELAYTYRLNSQSIKAVEILEHVVAVQESVSTEDDRRLMSSQQELARSYQASGQAVKAIELLRKLLGVQERVLAEDDSRRLMSQRELAVSLVVDGHVAEATEMLEKVVEIQERMSAEDDPFRLGSQHQLARVYQNQGHTAEAIDMLEKVIKIQKRVLPQDTPHQLMAQQELARIYHANGQPARAAEILEKVAEIKERTLSEDNQDRLSSQQELARMCQADGQTAKAVKILEKVVEIKMRALAGDDEDLIESQRELGFMYLADGQAAKALEIFKTVAEITDRLLAEDNQSRITSKHDLAIALWYSQEYTAALQLIRRAEELRERFPTANDPYEEKGKKWLRYMERIYARDHSKP